jgi:hypothetical protein
LHDLRDRLDQNCDAGSCTLKARGFRIERALQPGRCNPRETQRNSAAPPGGEAAGLAVAHDRRSKRVRHYQATIIGDQRGGKPACDGKVQAVGKFAIARPFSVGAEIGERALDLDSDDLTAPPQSQDIGAAAVGEREFDESGVAKLAQGAANSARQETGINRFGGEYVGGRNGHNGGILDAQSGLVVDERPGAAGGEC